SHDEQSVKTIVFLRFVRYPSGRARGEPMGHLTLGVLGFVGLVVIYGAAGIRVAQEYQRAVVFRLGRFKGVRGPGLYWIAPMFEWQRMLDLRVTTWDVELQEV